MDRWLDIADGVLVRRHEHLHLNTGLILGDKACVIVDTRAHLQQGSEFAQAVRRVTRLPWIVVNTHAHFDHWYGNGAFTAAEIWARHGFREYVEAHDARVRDYIVSGLRSFGQFDMASAVESADPPLPDRIVYDRATLDIGGRVVHLVADGRGHSDHDLAIGVPDAGVTFWGDLVESSDDPQMDDAWPREWGTTLSRLLDTVELGLARRMIPGHGSAMSRERVDAQCDQLQRLAWLLAEAIDTGDRDVESLIRRCESTGLRHETLEFAARQALNQS